MGDMGILKNSNTSMGTEETWSASQQMLPRFILNHIVKFPP